MSEIADDGSSKDKMKISDKAKEDNGAGNIVKEDDGFQIVAGCSKDIDKFQNTESEESKKSDDITKCKVLFNYCVKSVFRLLLWNLEA